MSAEQQQQQQQEPVIAEKGEGYVHLNHIPEQGSELDKWFQDVIEKYFYVHVVHKTSQFVRGFMLQGLGGIRSGSFQVWVPKSYQAEEFLGRYSRGPYQHYIRRIDSK